MENVFIAENGIMHLEGTYGIQDPLTRTAKEIGHSRTNAAIAEFLSKTGEPHIEMLSEERQIELMDTMWDYYEAMAADEYEMNSIDLQLEMAWDY